MKKLILILAIVAMFCGAVFAEDLLTIKSDQQGHTWKDYTLRSFVLKESGELVMVITREKSLLDADYIKNGRPYPHDAWQYTFKSENGKIVLTKTLKGDYHPPQRVEALQPEKYEWEGEK